MDAWSTLERNCINLLGAVMRCDYDTAAAIFYNANGPHQYRQLFEALSETRCDEKQAAAISSILGRIKKFAKKRNSIVHGDWIMHIEWMRDDATGTEYEMFQARRCANSQSKKKREEIAMSDELRNRDWFSRTDISRITQSISELGDDILSVIREHWA